MKFSKTGGKKKWQKNLSREQRVLKAAEAEEAVKTSLHVGTVESHQLCLDISKQAGGVCFLGFSRGKDSIAAWLYLQNFFSRIIPFHCTSVPALIFVNQSLQYYENYFKTEILNFIDTACVSAIKAMVYQPREDEEAIDNLSWYQYDKHDIVDYLKKEIARLLALKGQGGLPQNLTCSQLTIDLSFGAWGEQVKCLQQILKNQGQHIYPEGLITGNFGRLTRQAVIRFQEKYKSEILTPFGLTGGNGFVGPKTREKVNYLLTR